MKSKAETLERRCLWMTTITNKLIPREFSSTLPNNLTTSCPTIVHNT